MDLACSFRLLDTDFCAFRTPTLYVPVMLVLRRRQFGAYRAI
jgi:hypothetical protein